MTKPTSLAMAFDEGVVRYAICGQPNGAPRDLVETIDGLLALYSGN